MNSTEKLAALLWEAYTAADCWKDNGPAGGSTLDPDKLAAWLLSHGVVLEPDDETCAKMWSAAGDAYDEAAVRPGIVWKEADHRAADAMRRVLRGEDK